MNDSELKPCPFCGNGKDEITKPKVVLNYNVGYYVECQSCFAKGGFASNKDGAIDFWNERVKENPYTDKDFITVP